MSNPHNAPRESIAPRGHYLTATQLTELREIAQDSPILHVLLDMYAKGEMSPGEWSHLAITTLAKAQTNAIKKATELAMLTPPPPIIINRAPFAYTDHLDAIGTLFQEAAVQMADAYRVNDLVKAKIFNDAVGAIKAAWPELVAKSLGKESSNATD